MKDAELVASFKAEDGDLQNDLFVHFDGFGGWDWLDVSEEGRRIYNVLFCEDSDEVEFDSPIDGLISAVAAGGHHTAYKHIAAALGVEPRALEHAVAAWCEDLDKPHPPPVKPDALFRMAKDHEVWLRDLYDGKDPVSPPDYTAAETVAATAPTAPDSTPEGDAT